MNPSQQPTADTAATDELSLDDLDQVSGGVGSFNGATQSNNSAIVGSGSASYDASSNGGDPTARASKDGYFTDGP